jgi:hypothetical protein
VGLTPARRLTPVGVPDPASPLPCGNGYARRAQEFGGSHVAPQIMEHATKRSLELLPRQQPLARRERMRRREDPVFVRTPRAEPERLHHKSRHRSDVTVTRPRGNPLCLASLWSAALAASEKGPSLTHATRSPRPLRLVEMRSGP